MTETTDHGFQIVRFKDANGVECTLQQSSAIDLSREGTVSSPGASFIWLGCDIEMPETYVAGTRMHLNTEQVKMLIGSLTSWLETGKFDRGEWPDVVGFDEKEIK